MPNRIVREGCLDSERVDALSEQAENFYKRLWNVVDDYGRFEVDPVVLLSRTYPRRVNRYTPEMVECMARRVLTRYRSTDYDLPGWSQEIPSGERLSAAGENTEQVSSTARNRGSGSVGQANDRHSSVLCWPRARGQPRRVGYDSEYDYGSGYAFAGRGRGGNQRLDC